MAIIRFHPHHANTVIYPIILKFEGKHTHDVSMSKVLKACQLRAEQLNIEAREVLAQFSDYVRGLK